MGRKKAVVEQPKRSGRKRAVKKRGRKKAVKVVVMKENSDGRKHKKVADFFDRCSATRKVSTGDGNFKHEIMLINFSYSSYMNDYSANGECGTFRVTVCGPKYDAVVIAFVSAIESIGFEIEDKKYGSEKSKAEARSPEREIH